MQKRGVQTSVFNKPSSFLFRNGVRKVRRIVSFSVVNGKFGTNSAKEVINRNESQTLELLKKLVSRSLMQSLIRQLLADHDQLQTGRRSAATPCHNCIPMSTRVSRRVYVSMEFSRIQLQIEENQGNLSQE